LPIRLSLCTITARRPQWFSWWYWNVTKQSLPPNEVVVIDDGSWPDQSGITRVTVPGNWTTGKKRMEAAKVATGDYILFIDDDDWYSPDTCARLWEARGDGVTGIERLIWYAPRHDRFGVEYTRLTHHPFIVKRTVAMSVGWPDIMDGEDREFYRGCPTIRRLSEPLYIGIQHTDNVFNRDRRMVAPFPREEALKILASERGEFYDRLSKIFDVETHHT
jgi:glycosyltransferase involved in cell wall biosynthesis